MKSNTATFQEDCRYSQWSCVFIVILRFVPIDISEVSLYKSITRNYGTIFPAVLVVEKFRFYERTKQILSISKDDLRNSENIQSYQNFLIHNSFMSVL